MCLTRPTFERLAAVVLITSGLETSAWAQTLVDASDLVPTRGFLSPPHLVGPIHQCADTILVERAVPGSSIQLSYNGRVDPNKTVQADAFGRAEFPIQK
jgi:hypothetical protein